MSSSKITGETVKKALEGCCDPELGVSVVDLGFVREVEVRGSEVRLHMIFGTKCCPFHTIVAQRIHKAVCGINGVTGVEIVVDRETPWHPDMMTEKGRKFLEFKD
ncbi:MAG: iron-sulfur cluster assembly protein [Methanobacteriota archaeon]